MNPELPADFDLQTFQLQVLNGIETLEEQDEDVKLQKQLYQEQADFQQFAHSQVERLERPLADLRKGLMNMIDIQRQKGPLYELILDELREKPFFLVKNEIESSLKKLDHRERALSFELDEVVAIAKHIIEEYERDKRTYAYTPDYYVERREQQGKKRRRNRSREEAVLEIYAIEVVARKDIRAYICPPLQSLSNDAYDIAKVITPILIPLVLAGTLAIPLQPLIFSHISLILARMGVAALCEDYNKKKEKKKD